ncbi:MAG: hypothetical protein WDO16_02025 [Bacteroidota bacterium]
MRIIDRLTKYLQQKKITAYSFERTCQVANGYLKKQQKGKGSIGSDILERIHKNYVDLNLVWLITGEEEMLYPDNVDRETRRLLLQDDKTYYTKDEMIKFLQERVILLEAALSDKEKIVALLESQLLKKKK